MSSPMRPLLRMILLVALATFSAGTADAQHVLGVNLEDYHGRGALVVGTNRGSAAERMICPDCREYHRITPGVNVITAVNGQPVRSTAEVARAISNSSANAQITILNLERGSERTYRTALGNARQGLLGSRSKSPKSGRTRPQSGSRANQDETNFYDPLGFLNSDDDNSTDSSSLGLDNSSLNYWNDRRMRNSGWSTSPDFAPAVR